MKRTKKIHAGIRHQASLSRTTKFGMVAMAAAVCRRFQDDFGQVSSASPALPALVKLVARVTFAGMGHIVYRESDDQSARAAKRAAWNEAAGRRTPTKAIWKALVLELVEAHDAARKAERVEQEQQDSPGRDGSAAVTIEQVRAAMRKTETVNGSPSLWWNDAELSAIINAGAAQGWLVRLSISQAQWTEVGASLAVAAAEPELSPLKSIEVEQVEGRIGELVHEDVSSWAAASALLAGISVAHDGPAYRKVDMTTTWENGEQVKTRVDVYAYGSDGSLGETLNARTLVRKQLESRLDVEGLSRFVGQTKAEILEAEARRVLDSVELGAA